MLHARLVVLSVLTVVLAYPARSGIAATSPPVAVVVADAYTREDAPNTTFDTDVLAVDANTAKNSFLWITVTGTEGRTVTSALLRLRVSDVSSAGSNHGGICPRRVRSVRSAVASLLFGNGQHARNSIKIIQRVVLYDDSPRPLTLALMDNHLGLDRLFKTPL